jgi:chemotaxis protein methyltransferase CheR
MMTINMNISIYKQLIEDNCGIHIDSFRTSILKKAIEKRMELLKINDDCRYLEYIQREESELKDLICLLTINESYFFREDSQFYLLVDTIIPQILAQEKEDSQIRILSAGCSSGEEAYSLAIALNEKFGSQTSKKFKIFAFDVDKQVIETAKKGIYGKSSFRAIEKDLLNNYFKPLKENQKQIELSLRKQVTFFEHNLLGSDFPAFLKHIDAIFYRNVSIYFKPRTQKVVFGKLAGILKQNGYLFMSATEIFAHNIGILNLIEFSNCFVFRQVESKVKTPIGSSSPKIKNDDYDLTSEKETVKKARPNATNSGKFEDTSENEMSLKIDFHHEVDSRCQFNKILELLKFEKRQEALECLQLIESQHSDSKKIKILKSRILYELNRLNEAKAICLDLIKKDQWYVWAYLHLGLIASDENNQKELVEHLKKAIYIKSTYWLPHYYLAKYYFNNSLKLLAAREMRNVVRLIEKNKLPLEEVELFLEPLCVEMIMTEFKEKLSQIEQETA